jgi:glutathione S-transferase
MLDELRASLGFQYWCVSLTILFVKMYGNSAIQGIFRIRSKTFMRPEDAIFFGKGVAPATQDHPVAYLATRCWQNDLENIPIYLFLGLAFVLSGGTSKSAAIYFTTFTIARVIHSLFYLVPRQPHRNIAYQVGVLTCFALAIHTCILLFT